MDKKLAFSLAAIIVVIIGATILLTPKPETGRNDVRTFDDCVKAGYSVIPETPMKCRTPDGRLFVEDCERFCGDGICQKNSCGETLDTCPKDCGYKRIDAASFYCRIYGGTVQVRHGTDGNDYSICIFPDGSECESWSYYRKLCNSTVTNIKGIANPAAEYCQKNRGKTQIKNDTNGNEYALCVFAGGKECEEWAFYRKECTP